MTIYVDPRCPAEVEAFIRHDAECRGEQVMPPQPFPWHRAAVRTLLKQMKETKQQTMVQPQ